MDRNLPKLYKEFALYDNYRSFPSIIDGLKPVERRVLYTAFEEASGGRFVKCARIDGMCTAKYHPHGTTYGTIVKMANIGFLDKQGNFGSRIGQETEPPAAMRYTETRLANLTKELAFKYIKYIPMVISDLDEKEPVYIPTMFPFCLLGETGEEYTQGIGTGYKTYFPSYNMIDLFKRLLWLLGKLNTEPIIKPLTDCNILSTSKELKELLTLNKKTIQVAGKIQPDRKNCKLILKSWPPGMKFSTILGKLESMTGKADIGYVDQSSGDVGTKIVFEVLKQRNRDNIFVILLEKLQKFVTSNVSFEPIVIDENNRVKSTTVDEMLLTTYNMFKNINSSMLSSEIQRLTEISIELTNLEKIKQPLATVLQGGQLTKDNYEQKAGEVARLANLDIKIVKELLSKYRIQRLFLVSTDTSVVQNEIIELQNNLTNLDDFVLDQYNNFKSE